jgi:hypothetical protein
MKTQQISINGNSQFYADLISESKAININGNMTSKGYWNLILSIRDCSMYAKFGMKPNRHWKISDVKAYFGIKGTSQSIHEQLVQIKEAITKG